MAKKKHAGHVIVALTPHEARLLVLAIDDATHTQRRWSPHEQATIEGVRADIMDGLSSLSKAKLTADDREA